MKLSLLSPRAKLRAFAKRLGASTSGAALVEIAVVMPLFMTLGMYGTEIAYMSSVNMQVSELSLALADNAARLGQTDHSGVTPTINETDIDSIMKGATTQGRDINFSTSGRVILSSLEFDDNTDRQYIHWQRCSGSLARNSQYGGQNYGLTGTQITGLGKPGQVVSASLGQAVMFVEIFYVYQPLFGRMFVGATEFRKEAAFIVRDHRNLTPGITGTGGTSQCT
jgi:Flp pilus assembly protein TadG